MMRVIAFNLSEISAGNICYFDDIKLEVKRAKKLTDIKLNVARNPYCEDEDATNFVGKDGDAGGAFSTNFVEGKGVGGSKGIVVKSIDNPTQGWDTQFFITLHRKLYAGDSFRLKFSYRADQKATAGTQSHGAPGDYIFWAGIGNIDFTTEWKTFDKLVNVTADMANKNGQPYGFQTIAFNLNDFKTANNYYFDNIFIYFDEEDATNADKKLAAEIAAASGGEEDDPNVDPALVAQAKERLFDAIQAAEAGKKAGASAYRSNVLQSTIDQANMLIDMDNATVSWVNNMILRLQSATATQMDADPQPTGVDIPESTYKGLKADLKKEVDAAQAVLDANQSKPEKQKNSLSLLINQANTILVTNYDSMDPEEFEEFINLTIKRLQDAETALKNAKEESTEPDTPVTEDKRVWLYNVGGKQLIAGGNDWATRASLVEAPMYFTPEVSGDGKYTLWSAPIYRRDNKDTWLGTDGYVDNYNEGQRYWTIEPVEGKEGVVTMSNGNGAYLYWDGGEATTTSMGAMPETAENGQWKLMKKADLEATFVDGTPDNPINATFYITNPNFSRCTDGRGWDMKANNKNLCGGGYWWGGNLCAESFHSEFTLSQTFSVPDGKYMLKAQGFYRQDGGDNEHLPVLYANGSTSTFPLRTGTENSMTAASDAFANGAYEIKPVIVDVVGGDLTVGVKLEGNTNLWCIWDNFRLYYIGDPDISAEKGAWLAMMQKLRNAISECKAYLNIPSYVNGRDEFAHLVEVAETSILDQPSTNINTIQATIDELNAAKVAFVAANKPIVEPGKVFIRNVASGKWWGAGNEWGTQASLNDHPDYVTLAMPAGFYTMESQVSNGGESYYFNGTYMDQTPALNLSIDEKLGKYLISASNFGYFGSNGTAVLASGLQADDDNALWQIYTENDMRHMLEEASVANPVDATWLITDAKFGRNNRNVDAWQVGGDCTNKALTGGNSNKYGAESYHSTFDIYQELKEVPNGVYAFEAQGFYRQDGEDNENLPVFYVNDETETFPEKTGSENSMADAATSFTAGNYTIEPIYVEVTDGNIRLGSRLQSNKSIWAIWANYPLTYYGADASIDAVKNSSVFIELAKLIEQAQDLEHQMEVKKVQEALTAAIEQGKAAKTLEEANAAIPVLKEAVGAGEASLLAKNVLPKMKELVDNNNIVTAEAYEEYYGQWVAKYEAGTLTKADVSALQDPSIVTGWHASITLGYEPRLQ